MRFAALLLCACATTRAVTFSAPEWPDYADTLASIHCAVAKEHGPRVADEALRVQVRVARGVSVLNGRTAMNGRTITVVDAESAWASSLRHEFFHHRVWFVVAGDVNAYDRNPDAEQSAKRMHAYAYQCRRGEP